MSLNKDKLVTPNEKKLFIALLILAVPIWLALILGTFGMALIFILLSIVFTIMVQARFISYLRGTGAIVTPEQFPDIYKQFDECCTTLGLEGKKRPTMFTLHMDGMFNAFATRFLRKHYVILLSDIIDALEDEPEAIKFYIGHELGHIDRDHIKWGAVFLPVSWLPLLGAGYSRSCETTCDRYGLACCNNESAAIKGMAALAVGATRWKTINIPAYLKQKELTKGFWMSYNEIIGDYPWLVRRIAYLHKDSVASSMPKRNPFAWALGLLTPRLGIMTIVIFYFIFVVSIGGMKASSMFANLEKTTVSLPVDDSNYSDSNDSGSSYKYRSDYESEGNSPDNFVITPDIQKDQP